MAQTSSVAYSSGAFCHSIKASVFLEAFTAKGGRETFWNAGVTTGAGIGLQVWFCTTRAQKRELMDFTGT